MHILQPKHIKLKQDEVDKLLLNLNISLTQLPKIKITDFGLPEGSELGDIIKIERIIEDKTIIYYRVVAVWITNKTNNLIDMRCRWGELSQLNRYKINSNKNSEHILIELVRI